MATLTKKRKSYYARIRWYENDYQQEKSVPLRTNLKSEALIRKNEIEEYEDTKRGLYSGSIGYITPNGDFDFNVVIRSILYNAEKAYISYSVGGAITANSIPEKEYEECLIKAKAMREALLNNA